MPSTSIHGTPDYAELEALGLQPQDVVYFSSNINPYGPPQSVVEGVRDYISRESISRYPDSLVLNLRDKLSDHYGLPRSALLVGNGTADLIWLICHRYAADGKQVAILSPTFSEYGDGVVMAGGHPTHIVLPGWQRIGPNHYAPSSVSFEQTCNALRAASPWVVFLCNPNNPTGEYFTPEQVRTLHKAAPHALWVVDEAYSAFTDAPWSVSEWVMEDGWIVLHSMTKDFALGALRLGFLIASPRIVAELQGVQPPWNVNGVAQYAGEIALNEMAWRQETMARLRKDLYDTRQHLMRMGYAPRESTTNYFLMPVGDAAEVRSALLAQRLVVRDCASFGLPEYIRIAVRQPEENELLLHALEEIATPAKQR